MFRTAVADELVPFTPCVLAKRILPKNIRANVIFTREAVQILISDVRLLQDCRVV